MNSALLGKSSGLCVCWLSGLCHYVLSVRQLCASFKCQLLECVYVRGHLTCLGLECIYVKNADNCPWVRIGVWLHYQLCDRQHAPCCTVLFCFPLQLHFHYTATGCGLLDFNFCFSSATNSRLYSLPLFLSLPLPLLSLTLLKHNRWSEGLKSQERSTVRNPRLVTERMCIIMKNKMKKMFCDLWLKLKSHRCFIIITLSAAETIADSQEVFSDLFIRAIFIVC